MKTFNDFIAVLPFETTAIRTQVASGVAFIKQRQELTKLTVVLPSADFEPGDFIWVLGEAMKHKYATDVYENEGKRFILVPKDQIRAIERHDSRPAPMEMPLPKDPK